MSGDYRELQSGARTKWLDWRGSLTSEICNLLVGFGLRTVLAENSDDPDYSEARLEGCFSRGTVSPTPAWEDSARLEFEIATKIDPGPEMDRLAEDFRTAREDITVNQARALIRWQIARGERIETFALQRLPAWERAYFQALCNWKQLKSGQVEPLLHEAIDLNPWQNAPRFALASFLADKDRDAALAVIKEDTVTVTEQIEVLEAWITEVPGKKYVDRVEPLRYTWAAGDKRLRACSRILLTEPNDSFQSRAKHSEVEEAIKSRDLEKLRSLSETIGDRELGRLLEIYLAIGAARERNFDLAVDQIEKVLKNV